MTANGAVDVDFTSDRIARFISVGACVWQHVDAELRLLEGRDAESVVGDARVASGIRTAHPDDLQRSIRLDLELANVVFDLLVANFPVNGGGRRSLRLAFQRGNAAFFKGNAALVIDDTRRRSRRPEALRLRRRRRRSRRSFIQRR